MDVTSHSPLAGNGVVLATRPARSKSRLPYEKMRSKRLLGLAVKLHKMRLVAIVDLPSRPYRVMVDRLARTGLALKRLAPTRLRLHKNFGRCPWSHVSPSFTTNYMNHLLPAVDARKDFALATVAARRRIPTLVQKN